MVKRSQLKDLVVAAVRLAIIRHDLAPAEEGSMSEGEAANIAQDTWDALCGLGTCEGEMVGELKDILNGR